MLLSRLPMWFDLAVVLGIMVFFHELGHFIVAKLCKVRVEVFSIGFGKRIWGFRRGDTDYRISILPLGGYVKMAGDVPGETPSGDPGEFNAHPRWQRALIALAGPIANFILAVVLMTTVYMAHNDVYDFLSGPAVTDYVGANTPAARTGIQTGDTIVHFDKTENPTWEDIGIRASMNLNQTVKFSYLHNGQRTDSTLFLPTTAGDPVEFLDKLGLSQRWQPGPLQIASITAGAPAELAGLQVGDSILSIDGQPMHSLPAVILYLQNQGGKPLTVLIERAGQQKSVTLSPVLLDGANGGKAYRIGFGPVMPPSHVEHYGFGKAVVASWEYNKKNSMLIVEVIQRLFTGRGSMNTLAGPIGIGQQIHEAAQVSMTSLVGLMSVISVNLGIMNLLPFPILDGGMLAFLLIESIIRRDVSVQIKERVYQVAFVCLIVFAIFVFYNDFARMQLFSHLKP